ncbi:MAG: hypothetical protein ACRD1S_02455, partial [Vicinamibacterales bacterium]
LAQAVTVIEAASRAVQESRTALKKQDYLGAGKALEGVRGRLDAVLRSLAPPARLRSGRPR